MSTSHKFSTQQTCSQVLKSCDMVCQGTTFSLATALTTDGGSTQRFFHLLSNGYRYNFLVPLCGKNTNTDKYDVSWYTSDIWQFSLSSSRNDQVDFYLGSLVLNSWQMGIYNGQQALAASYTNGQKCNNQPNSANRAATLYLVCDSRYYATAPLIVITEGPAVCQCNFYLYLSLSKVMNLILLITIIQTPYKSL